MKFFVPFLSLFLLSSLAHAINKCVDAKGGVTYTQLPCNLAETAGDAHAPAVPAAHSRQLGDAFNKYLEALKSDNLAYFLSSLSTRQRKLQESGGQQSLKVAREQLPPALEMLAEEITPAGDKGVLKVKGVDKGAGPGKAVTTYGTVELVKESGLWRVHQLVWSDAQRATVAQAKPLR